MGKYFIDGGAHAGESVRLFRSQYPAADTFKVISFEPNPQKASIFASSEFSDVEFHNLAIWTHDGTISFYDQPSHGEPQWSIACSVHGENRYIRGSRSIEIPCIDFSKWMKERFTADDYIILKLDIEGSEYEVLDKMFAEGTFDLIDKLYIEWHWLQRRTISDERHLATVAEVEGRGIKNLFWHAATVNPVIAEKDLL
jgi:FkbM family methyltransferase